ncbi:centrosomal protein of 170 kDa protein B-like isoform X1 [Brienomyrus brachyistius]|uniref:centrosomal protein of 170 kDa protein B-like isoform X1 n=1 Tax=Brienomyrus brachyistius TaxID=42636 RepID=UPI0020B3B9B1|nr:centrosomal protein of 170 kDa protein B-like isoform X1 [Brienomyrus brachyistius]
MSVTSWFLVSSSGTRHRLPRELIFVGREDCELMLQSRSVDKQHAVINYDMSSDKHLVKDLGSLNGTFVNDQRIPDQTYIALKLSDVIRFGYDSQVYILERSQHKVPEEALKHEKYTSQLQMTLKASEEKRLGEADGDVAEAQRSTEQKAISEAPMSRPTPLYGQPSWWGEDDTGSKGHLNSEHQQHEGSPKEGSAIMPEVNCSDYRESQDDSIYSYRREPSYFEIPTKEFQTQPKTHEAELHEIPTKDTDTPPLASTITPTPPVVQSHASFTIEFDDCMPGKMKIKDHVTKFSTRQLKLPRKQLAATPTEVMSAESKVADWLVNSNVSMMRQKNPSEDVYSTKSDLAMHIKTLKGHQHEDGTQSDSEDPVLKQKCSTTSNLVQPQPSVQSQQSVLRHQLLPTKFTLPTPAISKETQSPSETPSSPQEIAKTSPQDVNQQAFIIEFFDDNPRKKRSQSFTHNSTHGDSYSALKAKLERRKAGGQGGERVSASSGQIPATQQVTIPLKGPGPGPPQRAGSLKREKGEERLSSAPSGSGFSSHSTSAVSTRPLASVAKTSKLDQDFTGDFVKECNKSTSPTKENTPPLPTSAPPVMETSTHLQTSPSPHTSPNLPPSINHAPTPDHTQPLSHTPTKYASPVLASVPPPPLSVSAHSMDPKASKAVRTEEEDSLSDAGTYTIEMEAPDKEVEEARSMIDKVFGVPDCPEYAGVTARVLRPIINKEQDQQAVQHQNQGGAGDFKAAPVQDVNSATPSDSLISQSQVHAASSAGTGASKWVSRWASLADGYSESGPTAALSQEDLSNADGHAKPMLSQCIDNTDVENSQGSRTRRLLPQVPQVEKLESAAPTIVIQHDPVTECNTSENGSTKPHQQESRKLHLQDDLDPDSLSDASKSDECSVVDRNKGSRARRNQEKTENEAKEPEKTASSVKSTSFYIGSEETYSKTDLAPALFPTRREQDGPPRISPAAVLARHSSNREPRRAVRPNASAPSLHSQGTDGQLKKEPNVSFVRQESFTKDRPSDDIPISRLPHISSQPALCIIEHGELYQSPSLNEVEQKHAGSSSHAGDSLSGDSDLDTGSTVSLISNKNAPSAPAKMLTSSILQKGKSSSSPSAQSLVARQPTARERLSEKRRAHVTDHTSKGEPNKRLQIRRSTGNRGSLDFTDEQQSSSLQYWPETASSDYESGSRLGTRKRLPAVLQKDSLKGAVYQALTRSNSLSSPRPTRASMLRRARLGEASDTEGTETDRASQGSDINPPTKAPADSKKLSRLDVLALPRKRTGSFTMPSDTESTSRADALNRSSELSTSIRKAGTTEMKPGAGKAPRTAPSKQPITRARSSSAKYSSTTAATQTPSITKAAPVQSKAKNEGSAVDNETSSFQHWSTHSAEIARLSQDLAKDLAMLAQEIHDVAGEADSGMGTATSPGSMPNTPASTISAREERIFPSLQATRFSQLIQHIPEASLNYQKVPPGAVGVRDPDPNMNEEDSKRRLWNREEVILDNLMLNPVSQLSLAIRENTEQLAEKMKSLFHNRTEVWEEIEAKISAENEVPILKTSNKEISSILKELRRVHKQLEVINTIIEPGRSTDPLSKVPSGGAKPTLASQPPTRGARSSAANATGKKPSEVRKKSLAGAGSQS